MIVFSVHDGAPNAAVPAPPEKLTEPVGVTGLAFVSVTVAVQVVARVAVSGLGEQESEDVVE